jgi:GNAT superfamily N-acetyltransferase
MIIIREALPEDSESVEIVVASATAILRRIYRPGPEAMVAKSRIAWELSRVVAVVDGEVVGTTQYYEKGDAICVIGWMVRQDWQRMGVGRALFSRLAEIAMVAGKRRLLARTIKETGNVLVFQKLGFAVLAEQPDTLFVSDLYSCLTEVEMEKILKTSQPHQS